MSKAIYVVATLALVLSCSPSRRGPGSGDDDDGNGGGDAGNNIGSSCASDTITAQQIPLDIYIELDQSSSMSDDNKWSSVTSAIGQFVGQSGLDGVSIGLGYFAVQAPPPTCSTLTCTTNTDCGSAACGPCFTLGSGAGECLGAYEALLGGADSCSAADYETPAVEFAPLPGVAGAITSSMTQHSPTTGTPTVQALTGALAHATSWANQHAGDAVVVVLATDGEPDDSCTPEDVPGVEAVATMGYAASPSIPTFVIGVGDDLSDLDGIAAAGGTGSAFLVDTNANVLQQFLDAMNAIRHSVLGCTYQIPVPSSGMPDYQEVNVVYTPGGGGMPETIPNVADAAHCPASGNAWYYNNAANPTQIILCSATCGVVTADTAGSVGIQLGCSTVIE
ncbi:MAG TPA: vWA domain-containing protein [Kofleriaceae bacterium]|jgi:hypothetical protein